MVFLFCTAIAVASTLLAHQFITTYNAEFHRNYFYYLVTFFAFAMYGIWAPIIMRVLLTSIVLENEVVKAVANFLPVLGVPFLLISWIMLVKMGFSLVEVRAGTKVYRIYFAYLAAIVTGVVGIYFFVDTTGWLFGKQLRTTEIAIFIVLELGYMILFSGTVIKYSKKQDLSHQKIINRFVLFMLLALVIRIVVLPFAFTGPWILAALILVYFMTNFIPLFYLKVNADMVFVPLHAEHPNEGKKEYIFEKYQISKREREIVEQICLGKTNQQIADTLFISLQTVKDHTHRIYTKIGINSRMKLVQMVNG
ncbi:MAG: helix-turn-helix transcriptional regulator [Maribacter sp.]|uniref:helix-turn-helix transcriptional regulator n=1 Tax=Maribacter sp. TaxID=1897614 RepID=UPI003C77CA34